MTSIVLTYPIAVGVVEGLQLHNVRVSDNAHDLQFAVLMEALASKPKSDGAESAATSNKIP
jgi:hypothetical protein